MSCQFFGVLFFDIGFLGEDCCGCQLMGFCGVEDVSIIGGCLNSEL